MSADWLDVETLAEDCGCAQCLPLSERLSHMVLCVECGNKRCPHATDHRWPCTGSNEPGQWGSAYGVLVSPEQLAEHDARIRGERGRRPPREHRCPTCEHCTVMEDAEACAEAAERRLAEQQAAVREVAGRLRQGSGGKSDPFHVGHDAADDLETALSDTAALDRAERAAGARALPSVLAAVLAERDRQDAKWGEQNHPDGTGPEYEFHRDLAMQQCEDRFRDGTGGWLDILAEEVYEAFAEEEPARLREELIQVAAVAVAWIEAIDRRADALDGGGES